MDGGVFLSRSYSFSLFCFSLSLSVLFFSFSFSLFLSFTLSLFLFSLSLSLSLSTFLPLSLSLTLVFFFLSLPLFIGFSVRYLQCVKYLMKRLLLLSHLQADCLQMICFDLFFNSLSKLCSSLSKYRIGVITHLQLKNE
jgi:hypothetical protein